MLLSNSQCCKSFHYWNEEAFFLEDCLILKGKRKLFFNILLLLSFWKFQKFPELSEAPLNALHCLRNSKILKAKKF